MPKHDERREGERRPSLTPSSRSTPRAASRQVDLRAEQFFGWPAQDLVGCTVDVLVADRVADPGPRPAGVDLLLSARRRGGPAGARRRCASARPAARAPTGGWPWRCATALDRGRGPAAGAPGAPGAAAGSHGAAPDGSAAPQEVPEISVIAHDLNNVISVMLIYSELIERAVKGRSMDEYLSEIRTAAEHGAELTALLRQAARRPTPAPTAVPESAPARLDEDLLLQAVQRYLGQPSGPEPIGVVVVDDHQMFAEGLVRLLDVEDDIDVRGSGSSAREAVDLVERLRPRVLLLDFDMPGGNGVVAAREIKARWPQTMIVMISGSTDDSLLLRAIDAGCSGYLTKDRAASEVASAVRTVAAGEALLSPAAMERLLPRLEKSLPRRRRRPHRARARGARAARPRRHAEDRRCRVVDNGGCRARRRGRHPHQAGCALDPRGGGDRHPRGRHRVQLPVLSPGPVPWSGGAVSGVA